MKITLRKRTIFIFLLLIGLLAYFNSFSVPFHYDDVPYIKENIDIKSSQLFSKWVGNGYSKIITDRVFLLFTFYLNYTINGLDTFGYHIVNLLIHISTAFLFYLLIAKYVDRENITTNPPGISFKGGIAASIFLLHPINTESVTYISSRSSVLSAFFILASMLCFFRATKDKFKIPSYLFSILFLILGLSSKESAIVIPALILLFDIYFVSNKERSFKARLKYHLPFWIIIAAGFIYFYSGYITGTVMRMRPWTTHILTEIRVFVQYLKLLILPIGLNIDHDIKASTTFDLPIIVSFIIILVFLIVALFLKNRNRVLSFSIFWFFINLAPFLVIRLEDYMAERWV